MEIKRKAEIILTQEEISILSKAHKIVDNLLIRIIEAVGYSDKTIYNGEDNISDDDLFTCEQTLDFLLPLNEGVMTTLLQTEATESTEKKDKENG